MNTIHKLTNIITELSFKIERLQEENKELKEKIDIYENSIIANHDRAVGKRLMEVLLALEEIRKLVKEQCESNCGLKLEYCMKQEGTKTCLIYKIKNEINEVLNDN